MNPNNLRERIRIMNSNFYLVLYDGIKELCAPLLELLRRPTDISHHRTLARPHKPYILRSQLRRRDRRRDSRLLTSVTYAFKNTMRDTLTAAP